MTVASHGVRKKKETCNRCGLPLNELNSHPYRCDQCNENEHAEYMPTLEEIARDRDIILEEKKQYWKEMTAGDFFEAKSLSTIRVVVDPFTRTRRGRDVQG